MKYANLGQAIEVSLAKHGHNGCYIVAFYDYDYDEQVYMVSMYCVSKDNEGWITSLTPVTRELEDGYYEIKQPLSGTKGTIRANICQVIDYMCENGLMDEFINTNTQEVV